LLLCYPHRMDEFARYLKQIWQDALPMPPLTVPQISFCVVIYTIKCFLIIRNRRNMYIRNSVVKLVLRIAVCRCIKNVKCSACRSYLHIKVNRVIKLVLQVVKRFGIVFQFIKINAIFSKIILNGHFKLFRKRNCTRRKLVAVMLNSVRAFGKPQIKSLWKGLPQRVLYSTINYYFEYSSRENSLQKSSPNVPLL